MGAEPEEGYSLTPAPLFYENKPEKGKSGQKQPSTSLRGKTRLHFLSDHVQTPIDEGRPVLPLVLRSSVCPRLLWPLQ